MVAVVVIAAPLGVTFAGEKLQAAFAGSPEQAKETAWEKPFEGVTVTVVVAEPEPVAVPLLEDRETANEGAGACIVTGTAAEVDGALPASPAYAAVRECEPTARAVVLKVAVPVVSRVPLPSELVPSRKLTEPVGTPLPVFGFTTAVNATCAPLTAVAGAAVSVVVVGVPAAMVNVTAAEFEAALPVSPPYCAVTLYTPAASVLLVNVAVPVLSSVPLPNAVVPLRKVTVPVGVVVPGFSATVAVKVTVCPAVAGLGATVNAVAVGVRIGSAVPYRFRNTSMADPAAITMSGCLSPFTSGAATKAEATPGARP
jgi:hypothetical protein